MAEPERRRIGRPPGVDGEETRKRILHAARRVFSSTGFDRASLAGIANEAGITRNAIARYYPDKVELHRAAFISISQDALTIIMGDIPGPDEPTMQRILGVFDAAIRMNDSDRSFVRFWVTAKFDALHHPELRDQSERQFNAVHAFFTDALAAGQARGEISSEVDPRDLGQVIADLLWGLAMDSGFQSDSQRVHRVLRALRMLLTGSAVSQPSLSGRPSAQ